MCEESGQGESISFRNDGKGFYTVSEAPDEDEAKDVNVPIFYYSLDEGILRNIAKHFRQPDLEIFDLKYVSRTWIKSSLL